MTELTIKIQLNDSAAYVAKTEAIKPILALLFECDEKDVTHYCQLDDTELEVKGKVTFTADFVMQYNTTKNDDDGAGGALDILTDYASLFCIYEKLEDGTHRPTSFATFSNIDVESVENCVTKKIE